MNKIIQNLISIVTGFLSNLTTTNKSNLVAAINEVNAKSSSGVESVVAGTNVTVNNTDPANPIVNASAGGGGTLQSAYDASILAYDDPQIIASSDDSKQDIAFVIRSIDASISCTLVMQNNSFLAQINNSNDGTGASIQFSHDGTVLISSNAGLYKIPNLISATDDTAAAAAGVPLTGIYHTSGTAKIRLV